MLQVNQYYSSNSSEIVKIQSTECSGDKQIFVGSDARLYNIDGVCLDGESKYNLVNEVPVSQNEKIAELIEAIYASDAFTIDAAYDYFVLGKSVQ